MCCLVLIKRFGEVQVEANFLNDPGDRYSPPDVGWEIESVTANGRDVFNLLNDDEMEQIFRKLERKRRW